jgi:amino acid transporter/mannitol/fructose-specific phosphotransferase system IIA component (Ntr-type)
LFDVYAISTGAMFSSGFFLLPGLAAAQTGPSVVLAYVVAGILVLPAMFSIAELATAMPKSGGMYYFLDRSMGPLVGTVGGMGAWVALVLKSAFALVGMGAYLGLLLDAPIEPLAVGLTILFGSINVLGAKETSGLQRFLVTALLAILSVFVLQGFLEVRSRGFMTLATERFSPFAPFGVAGFISTIGFVFVSYAGITKVASVAEEVSNPDRNLPLGMMLSVATAILAYALAVSILVAVLPPTEFREDLTPVATAASVLFGWLPGRSGLVLIVVAASAAFASTANAGILAASRYPLAMARDRLVPSIFGVLGRFRTPSVSVVATAGAIIAAIVLLDVDQIAKLASAFLLLLFALLNLALVIMRESRIDGYDPGYRTPFYPWLQVVGILAPFWIITEMGQVAILLTLGLVSLTVIWFFFYVSDRVERTGAIFHTFARWGKLRHRGLDVELRGIVKEKGLREEDPFEELVARAAVMDFDEIVTFSELIRLASRRLGPITEVKPEVLERGLREGVESGFVPVARGAALPHLRVAGLGRPTLLVARCAAGVRLEGKSPDRDSEDPTPLQAVFILISPREEPGQHLRILGHLATVVDEPSFLPAWRTAKGEAQLRETLVREERSLTLRVAVGLPTEAWAGQPLRALRLPRGTLVAVVRRAGVPLIPDGSTVLMNGDHLTIIGNPDAIIVLAKDFGAKGGS